MLIELKYLNVTYAAKRINLFLNDVYSIQIFINRT